MVAVTPELQAHAERARLAPHRRVLEHVEEGAVLDDVGERAAHHGLHELARRPELGPAITSRLLLDLRRQPIGFPGDHPQRVGVGPVGHQRMGESIHCLGRVDTVRQVGVVVGVRHRY